MTLDGVVYVGRDAAVSLQASRDLRENRHRSILRQYHTNARISSSVTTICVNSATFSGAFSTALDAEIANDNHLGLRFRMQRTSGDSVGCSTINAVIVSGVTSGKPGFPLVVSRSILINIGDGLSGRVLRRHPDHDLLHVDGDGRADACRAVVFAGNQLAVPAQDCVGRD